ncbi:MULTISPECIES: hypothetical protein [Streptomyces]|uniref:Uncharacterized protein n=1 Tax=Streptomyces bacillaris TaxID=68179 RepID=A0ABW6E0D5_9ACTN|nr:hypothetical protein [Streptomyces nanshensis]
MIQDSWTTKTAVPVARVLMAGLADRGISPSARHRFLELLSSLTVVDDEGIAEECRRRCETVPARLERLLATARHLLPEDVCEED